MGEIRRPDWLDLDALDPEVAVVCLECRMEWTERFKGTTCGDCGGPLMTRDGTVLAGASKGDPLGEERAGIHEEQADSVEWEGSRYPWLRTLATVYFWMAGIAAAVGAFSLVTSIRAQLGGGSEAAIELLWEIGLTALMVLTLLAVGQGIRLMIDIESNSRRAADALEKFTAAEGL